jgi:hypothetical protein
VLHLEGETWVRERVEGGGRDGDRWFKMAHAVVCEEGGLEFRGTTWWEEEVGPGAARA